MFVSFERYSKEKQSLLITKDSMENNFHRLLNVEQNRSIEEQRVFECQQNVEN